MRRCLNCGLPGHLTRVCPSWGPRCPGPGKSTEDYADEDARIRELVAQDILDEHKEAE